MSLNNEFRVQEVKEFCGMPVEAKKLFEYIKEGRVPNSILITGDYGTGKTTLARLIAKELGVYDRDKKTNVDFNETNCADLRGIDVARDIIKNVEYRPTQGDYRVWLIDEAHQMTKDFQDAVLKLTEEPPEYAVFIFCTNNPSKFTAGFKRRCYEITLKNLEPEKIICILEDADLNINKRLLTTIAMQCNGSTGMAYKIADNIKDLSPKEQEKKILDFDNTEVGAKNLCQLLIKRDPKLWSNIVEVLKELEKNEVDPEQVRRAVLGYCKACYSNSKIASSIYIVSSAFERNVWDSGFPGIYNRCFEAINQ